MSDDIGIGIVGTGFAERVQLPGLAHVDGARPVAIASGHRENAERVARQFNIPHVCDSHDDLASNPDVDLVIISAPPFMHAPAAIAAARAGKAVLCEKPMALNVAEADEMIRAVDAAGVLGVVDHELRFSPNRRRVKQLIDEGYLGRVLHVSAVYRANIGRRHGAFTWWYQASTGGGLLGAIGSHIVDTVRWWTGEVEAAACTLRTFVEQRPDAQTGEMRRVESDDFASLTLRGASGVTIEASMSSVTPGPTAHRFEVVGETGLLLLDEEQLTLTGWTGDRTDDFTVADPSRTLAGLPNQLWAPAFVNIAREVVSALRDGRTSVPNAATFRDGRAVQVVLDEARRIAQA